MLSFEENDHDFSGNKINLGNMKCNKYIDGDKAATAYTASVPCCQIVYHGAGGDEPSLLSVYLSLS